MHLLVYALVSFLLREGLAFAQAPVPLKSYQTIPGKPFTSWSLFLVCDPVWLWPGQEVALSNLQIRYRAVWVRKAGNEIVYVTLPSSSTFSVVCSFLAAIVDRTFKSVSTNELPKPSENGLQTS